MKKPFLVFLLALFLTACAGQKPTMNEPTPSKAPIVTSQTDPIDTDPQQTNEVLHQALTYALSDAQLNEDAITLTKSRLDIDDGITYYDIAFYTSEAEYDYEFTTDFIIRNKEVTYFVNQGNDPSASKITVEEAQAIALTHAQLNATDITFTEAREDFDDRRSVFDISFYYGIREYDYTIDAYSGTIIEFEID